MSLSQRSIPQLFNGVSRQPAILRSADQTEDELNTWSWLASGVGKRPPTQHIAKLANSISGGAFLHTINRDTDERYVMVIEGGTIKVYDLLGNPKVVNAPAGLGYVASGTFAAVTVADYTFIVNRSVVCELDELGADTTADPDYLRWINRTSTPEMALYGDVYPGGEFQYDTNPSGGTYMGEVATMTKLPDSAANGTIYKVKGSTESAFTSYYVRRNGAVWDETVAPGLVNAIKPSTMPHCLVREADGTFTFAPFSWAPRRAGDAGTNPAPTFIGRTIQDLYFYQNRLALIVDENVTMSCTGDFGNFWRTTVLDAIATDVVDIAVTSNKVSILLHAVLFNDGALLFSDQTQFSMTNAEEGVSASTLAVKPVTNYRITKEVRPALVGTEVYFTGEEGGASVVWEYTRQQDSDSTAAADITAHVPGYIPTGLKGLVPLPKGVLAYTGGPDVYVYQLYWSGNEKIQSAWRKWTFAGDSVLHGSLIDNRAYLVIQRTSGLYLECIELSPTAKPASQPKPVHLDRLGKAVGVYDGVNDVTVFTLPYSPIQDRFQLIRPIGTTAPHSLVDPSTYTWLNANTVEVPGDEHGTYDCGERYEMVFQFSEQFAKDYQGVPMTSGRLQLRTWRVNYADTAYFRTLVRPYGAAADPEVVDIVPAKLDEFTGKVIGVESLRLNQPVYHTGSYAFQIYGESRLATITLTNDTHVGSTFVSAEWEAFYTNRAFG